VADVVLDASALLAFLNSEPGAEVVARFLPGGIVSAVNLVEAIGKLVQKGASAAEAFRKLSLLDLRVRDFTESQAEATGALLGDRHARTLSLGDRACLALAAEQQLPVLTADREWTKVELGVSITLIR
jgi:PIN domain nuclease of toxin-antitoxin system